MSTDYSSGRLITLHLLALIALVFVVSKADAQAPGSTTANLFAKEKHEQPEDRGSLQHYRGENGLISAKTLILGGEFRITTVIPFKGNFAEYRELEIVQPASLVGSALSAEVKEKEAERFRAQFAARRLFQTVRIVPSFKAVPQQARVGQHQDETASIELLNTPIGTIEDMRRSDRAREARDRAPEQTAVKTLVAYIEVIDYEKGSRWKQALPLDLGKSILTVRVRYYDKDSGEEIGRQIISGQQDGSSLLGPLSPRDGLAAVTEGFVDQVTRRVAASEK
ncbi:MAG TPA: hypothetical protein VEZ90_17525 [Blastocatellia bacterium]|nr:hypothetical protein [Blastocatellia bacterium]